MPLKPVDTAIVVVVGPCIDDTDFKTQETSLAYNAAGMSLDWIQEKTDGATVKTDLTLTTSGNNDWTHVGNGYYSVEITAAQNNEEGIGWVAGMCTGVLPFESPHYDIVPTQVYDSLVKGSDLLDTNTAQISGDTTAADNCELMFDGTGYAGGTAKLGVDVISISGDTTAADNCELMFDGTGYAGGTTKLDVNVATVSAGAITNTACADDIDVNVKTMTAGVITATVIANDAIDLATFAADCKTGSALKANVETISANAITATAIADGAIDNATFAADVGSTAYATNIIALASRKALDDYDPPTNTEFEARTLAAADYTIVSDLGTVQTGDAFAVVNHADYGNAKLVRSTTPANTLTVDAAHLVAVPTTQKVDVETIKTQTITCAAGVTVLASVGTAATSTAQTGDSFAIVNGDHGLVSIQDDVDMIKAKTDLLTYTVAGKVDANMEYINATELTGNGGTTPWGPV